MSAHANEAWGGSYKATPLTVPLNIPIITEAPRSWDEQKVLEAVQRRGGIPDRMTYESRARALHLLKSVLLDSLPVGMDLRIVPVGSYALDVWTVSSNLDCLCIGSFSRTTFIEFATARLRQAASRGITSIRRLETQAGATLKLEIRLPGQMEATRIDLTYAPSIWPVPAPDPAVSTSPETQWALRAFREAEYAQQTVPDIQAFRLAHRFIRVWAEGRGIYSATLGYLSGTQITILLTRVVKMLAQHRTAPRVTELLLEFYKKYASFDWRQDDVFDWSFHSDLRYSRTKDEPLAILSYFPPALNTSLAASTSTVWTMEREFQRQQELIESKMGKGDQEELADPNDLAIESAEEDILESVEGQDKSKKVKANARDWDRLLADNATFYPGDSLRGCMTYPYKLHLKTSAQYWGGSITKGRAFVSWLESRFKSLHVDFERASPGMRFTFWPVRFAERDLDEQTAGRYMYLCGVEWEMEDDQEAFSRDYNALMRRLDRFAHQVQTDTRHFDGNCLGFDIGPVKLGSSDPDTGHPDLDDHRVDPRNWDAYLPADDDEEDGEEQGEGQAVSDQSEWYAAAAQNRKERKKPATNQPRSAVVPKKEGAGKFRPAADVLNRLRWDQAYDHCDFLVGYEDRFVGAMEKGLDLWKLEQTHEEFIPQHRILYFKRKGDGVVVWERRTRVDLVFGSG